MKYITILTDGMADYPIESIGGMTPMEKAYKPNMNELASKSLVGMVTTVPNELSPGSDVANLAVMGYNPLQCYTGRSPLEAASIGVKLDAKDITFRCNLVTLSDERDYANKTMVDYSSDEISTEDAHILMKAIAEELDTDILKFYGGTSYRHLLVYQNGSVNCTLTPPHDISDRKIGDYLPKGENSEVLLAIMKRSHDILKNHPLNKERIQKGLHPANSLWIWGQGSRPELENFNQKFGLKAGVIAAVDLIKGIAKTAGMKVYEVEGATGGIETNFSGKAQACVKALLEDNMDYIYLHIESPDECGHKGDLKAKIHSIETIDCEVVGFIVSSLKQAGIDFRLLVTPDHPTPISIKTHARDPIPFFIYDSTRELPNAITCYCEKEAKNTGLIIEKGYTLINHLLNR